MGKATCWPSRGSRARTGAVRAGGSGGRARTRFARARGGTRSSAAAAGFLGLRSGRRAARRDRDRSAANPAAATGRMRPSRAARPADASGNRRRPRRPSHFAQRPFDAHLPAQALPVEQQRRIGILRDLAPLAAFGVGVEHESVRSVALQQHHPHRRTPSLRRRGQRHGVGVVRLARLRLGEPRIEQLERVRVGDRVLFSFHGVSLTKLTTLTGSRPKCRLARERVTLTKTPTDGAAPSCPSPRLRKRSRKALLARTHCCT